MTATEEYHLILDERLRHPLPKDEYGETHHIIPRSLGGPDEWWNLVRLSAQEHYRVHELLPNVMKENGNENGYRKMLSAWYLMTHTRKDNIKLSSEEYSRFHKDYIESVRERQQSIMRGKPSPMKGRHHTEESKAKNAEKHRGKTAWNKGLFGEGSPMYGKKHSPETIQKMREAAKRRKPISEETRRRLSESHKEYYRKRREAV